MSSKEPYPDPGRVEVTRRVESGEYTIYEQPARSRVWAMFAKIRMPNGEQFRGYAFCMHCRSAVKCANMQTSSLLRHKCFKEEEQKTADTTQNFDIDDTTNLTNIFTKLIITECRSYDFIQSKGLKEVFKEIARFGSKYGDNLNIDKLLPSLPDVTDRVSEIYSQCFDRIKSEIALAKEHGLSLTADVAMDNLSKENYIVLTAHYNRSGVLKCRFLGLQAFEANTGQNISTIIRQILEDFECKLSTKFTLVADPANGLAVKVPDVQNVKCMSQLLSKALLKSVEEVPEVSETITACSNLVNYLIKNGHEEVLGNLVENPYHNSWLKLYNILNLVETNWNTIESLLQSIKEKARILEINVPRLQAVIKALQPFEEAIETLENSNDTTLHLVVVYLHELKKSCDTVDKDFGCIERLKANLHSSIENIEREDISTLHKIALFLYPPTNKLLQFNDKEKRRIEDECLKLINSYKSAEKPLEPELLTPPLCKRKKLLSDFLQSETRDDSNERLSHEIHFYKNCRVVDIANFDAFSWWEVQKINFPFLYKLSCTVLATPATCAASKRIFANGINLFREKYSQISKEAEMEQIIFLNSNLESHEIASYFPVVSYESN